MTRGKEPITRGPDGLLPAQREYLQKYAETGTEAEARRVLGLSNRRIARWHREEEAFRKAYDETIGSVHEAVAQRLKGVEEELPDAIRRLMHGVKPIPVKCPGCGEKFTVDVENQTVQARIVEMMMKAQGHLKDVRRLEGEAIITHLTLGQRMALSMHNAGKEISEQSRRDLLNLGLIEEEVPPLTGPDVVEGEAHEVDPQEDD
jgi:hypothetical protein